MAEANVFHGHESSCGHTHLIEDGLHSCSVDPRRLEVNEDEVVVGAVGHYGVAQLLGGEGGGAQGGEWVSGRQKQADLVGARGVSLKGGRASIDSGRPDILRKELKSALPHLHPLAQGLAVGDDLLLVAPELLGVGLLQGHRQGGDGVVVGAALQALRSEGERGGRGEAGSENML